MSKKILWKTSKEVNMERERGSLLVALIEFGGKKSINTVMLENDNLFHVQRLLSTDNGKTSFLSTIGNGYELEDIKKWCYFDEFVAGIF